MLKRPQHLDGFAHAHVVEVEVDQTSKSHDGNHIPQLVDPWHKLLQVVCQHATNAPVFSREK